MDHDMKCRSATCRMAGPAATLRVHTADILMVPKAISTSPAGSVLVIDGQGELNTALWGELTTLAARLKGLAGVVIDGAVRDVEGIRREQLPVFARAVVPNAGGAEYEGELGVPVQCGGVVVSPGDWIVGDEDGVVVLPSARVHEVIELAERVQAAETRIEAEIRGGADLATLARVDEVLADKAAHPFLPQLRSEGRAG
jgi:RraA family protein